MWFISKFKTQLKMSLRLIKNRALQAYGGCGGISKVSVISLYATWKESRRIQEWRQLVWKPMSFIV
jgi:hypothetical protein